MLFDCNPVFLKDRVKFKWIMPLGEFGKLSHYCISTKVTFSLVLIFVENSISSKFSEKLSRTLALLHRSSLRICTILQCNNKFLSKCLHEYLYPKQSKFKLHINRKILFESPKSFFEKCFHSAFSISRTPKHRENCSRYQIVFSLSME